MKKLWDFWKTKDYGKKSKILMFLLSHVVIWGLFGTAVWGFFSLFVLKEIKWLFLIVGYAVIFPGFFGGVLYEMNKEQEMA